MPKMQKYGPISAYATEKSVPQAITASETFRARSGRFVTLNTSTGAVEVADAGESLLYGWAETGDGVKSAGDKANVILAAGCNEIFRIPVITGTPTVAMIGLTCDLVRATTGGDTLIQGAKVTASGEDVIVIVGIDEVDGDFVDVMFTPGKVTGMTGVA